MPKMDIQWISIGYPFHTRRDFHQYPWISISIHGYPWTVHSTPHLNGETFMKRITTDPFERVHLKFIKWVLGVHKKTTNTACYGETGRAPISITVLNQALHYFARVMSKCGDEKSLLGLAAKEQKSLQLDWYTFWNKLHTDTGPARQSMELQMVTFWESLRHEQSKMSFYNSVKPNYARWP